MRRLEVEEWEREHEKHIDEVLDEVEMLYHSGAADMVGLGMLYAYDPARGELFRFSASKRLRQQAEKRLEELHDRLVALVQGGMQSAWAFANEKNDAWVRALYSDPKRGYMLPNQEALAAFRNRKIYGHTLSERVWNYTGQFASQVELALSVGLLEGRSAAQIARDVRQYLREPEALFRRVREGFGQCAQAYHPGQGVYRSSYQNALRMTRTEINAAYRQADYERWQQLDFVVGIQIRTSGAHTQWLERVWNPRFGSSEAPEEICDALEGRYPKDFKFIGWHPNCRCYAVPILADKRPNPTNRVEQVPARLHEWLEQNADRIERANNRGTLPYWIAENKKYIGILATKGRFRLTPEQKAYRKEIQREAIARFKGAEVENRMKIRITASGVKEYLNQPHARYFEKNELVKDLPALIRSAKYIGINPTYSHERVKYSHIFEVIIGGEKSWLIIREYKDGRVLFHSCSSDQKIAAGLKK